VRDEYTGIVKSPDMVEYEKYVDDTREGKLPNKEEKNIDNDSNKESGE
jgi:hypothetical protein